MTTLAESRWGAPGSRAVLDPFVVSRHRVVGRRVETADVVTLVLEPVDEPIAESRPGQFNMVTAFGVGEAAISLSGPADRDGRFRHTIRAVGPVSAALTRCIVGDVVGIRGPFGTDWGVGDVGRRDVVVIAGGIGLAPLRSTVSELVVRQHRGGGRLFVLIGARSPADLVFADEYAAWSGAGAYVETIVDVGDASWRGHVGVVTTLILGAGFDPAATTAMICGPEVMMRFCARALIDQGVDPDRILVSAERNMQCGVGLCGHCQLGPLLLCRDGPVLSYSGIVPVLIGERER